MQTRFFQIDIDLHQNVRSISQREAAGVAQHGKNERASAKVPRLSLETGAAGAMPFGKDICNLRISFAGVVPGQPS